jgi:cyclic peptide transporter
MIKSALRQQKGKFILAIVLSISSACLSIYVLSSINSLATVGLLSVEDNGKVLLGIIALFITSFASQSVLSVTGTRMIASIRSSLSEQFLKQPFEQLMAMRKGYATGTLISDVTRIASMLMVAPLMIFNVLVLLFCLAYLATISISLFWVLCGFLFVAIGTSAFILGRAQRHFTEMRSAEDKLFEGFRAIEEAKRELSNDDRRVDFFMSSEITPSVELTREKDLHAQLWWNFSGSWSTAMIFIALLSIIYSGSTWLMLSSEILLQFVIVTLYMTGPIAFIVNSNQAIGRGLTSVNRINALNLQVPRELSYPAEPQLWTAIELNDVTYQYKSEDTHFNFGPFSYRFERGQCYFIVGGNGSGKSTLAQILTGLIPPDSGDIRIDGNLVVDKQKHHYRALSSSVFFDVYLFKFFLNANANLASDEDIYAFAKLFSIDHKLDISNGRIQSDRFSQGQKKRIALIQSLLQDKDMLLFDEVAADQDPEFKHFFYHSLLPQLKAEGKTLIVISHDDRYFDCADSLLKMEDGKLVRQTQQEVRFEQVV